MSKPKDDLRSCPKCGSEYYTYWEIGESRDGNELYDFLKCDECGCVYRLVFVFVKKEEA